jgi:hypothetical protein
MTDTAVLALKRFLGEIGGAEGGVKKATVFHKGPD